MQCVGGMLKLILRLLLILLVLEGLDLTGLLLLFLQDSSPVKEGEEEGQ